MMQQQEQDIRIAEVMAQALALTSNLNVQMLVMSLMVLILTQRLFPFHSKVNQFTLETMIHITNLILNNIHHLQNFGSVKTDTLSSLLKIERLFLKIYVFTTSFFFLFHMTVSVSLSITRSDQ